ncbi:MAG: peptidase U32 family protein [Christensenellales bacterium]
MPPCELLSPAGSMECLQTALRFGADAVYVGGPLMQLRANNTGFSFEELEAAVQYSHALEKKIYVAVNAFADNQEAERMADYGKFLSSIGADAVIVSDLGVLVTIKEAAPCLEVHVSTQANCMNYKTAQTYYDLGAKRIVLAREMSLEQIAELRQKTPLGLELEAFVHGAMCMAYSGRCMISSFLTNRSGNKGGCSQPCRWNFTLMEEKRPNEFFPVEETPAGTAILSSHDLNCVAFLDQMKDAGITSFKIEGRMKTPYYVATVTNAYRCRLDNTAPLALLEKELESVSHRPYSSGFYFGEMKADHYNDGAYRSECQFAGVVLGYRYGRITVQQRNHFRQGDTLEAVSPSKLGMSFVVENMRNQEGEPRESAPHPEQVLTMDCPYELKEGDLLRLRLTKDAKKG